MKTVFNIDAFTFEYPEEEGGKFKVTAYDSRGKMGEGDVLSKEDFDKALDGDDSADIYEFTFNEKAGKALLEDLAEYNKPVNRSEVMKDCWVSRHSRSGEILGYNICFINKLLDDIKLYDDDGNEITKAGAKTFKLEALYETDDLPSDIIMAKVNFDQRVCDTLAEVIGNITKE